jgi:hypothetical protein
MTPNEPNDAVERNSQRAVCGLEAMKAYSAVKGHNTTDVWDFASEDARDRLVDLLADLRHWAREAGVNYVNADRIAADHFKAEVAEETEEGGAS